MKKTLLTGIAFTAVLSGYSQTLFVPNGTSGIGTSANGNIGIDAGSPISKLDVNGDIQLRNASLPMGLMTEVGGTTPLLNLSLNFREPNKNFAYRGMAFRLDSRGGELPSFQWLTRSSGSSVENLVMSLSENGKLGLGTTAPPLGQLEIYGTGDLVMRALDNDAGDLVFLKNDKTQMGRIWTSSEGHIYLSSNDNISDISINQTGNVGIGTTSPNQKLTVNGTIYGKEVKVDLSVPGPDYVFDEEYALSSLESVKNYIDQNKHLPEVPSAKEMETNGINLSEMNMLLLKKVEELTLYMIEQNKINNAQQKQLEEAVKKINQQQIQIELLIRK